MWIEDVSFRWKLRKLQKSKEKIWSKFRPELNAARDAKNWNEEQSIASCAFFETDMVQGDIRRLQHKYVVKQAERLLLPIPKFSTKSDEWVQSEFDGSWSLTPEKLADLGRDVRREWRERLELVFLWPSSVIGLVGGLTGIATAFFL